MERFIQGNYFVFLHLCTVLIIIFAKFTLSDICCDFNDGIMCDGWTFEQNTTLCAANWTFGNGLRKTEPPGRHKEGYYIYMETTNQKHSDIAIFYTPDLHSINKTVNTNFSYYMHGTFIQTLKVYVSSQGGGQELIVTIQDEQGDQWKSCNVYFEQDKPFKLEFRAMVGLSAASDIAVDEIEIIGAEKYLPKNNMSVHKTNHSTTTIQNIVPMKEEYDYITLPYIIVCAIGGIMWVIIVILLCCCIHRSHTLSDAKRTVGCNTKSTVFIDDKNDDNVDNHLYQDLLANRKAVSIQHIELTLDVRQLTENKCYETKL